VVQARELSKSPTTPRNLDKRSARLKYGQAFASDIAQNQAAKKCPMHRVGENLHRRGARNGVSVFIRKRPIFDFEVERGDFDVVFTEGRHDHDAVVVHSCNIYADMRKLLVKPTAFPCSAAFDETCTNDMLYMAVGKPMVKLAANGGLATILTFGQTGSGKTHTITGIEERVARDLFRMVSLQSQQVTIQFIELEGKHGNDLLGERNVKILEQHDGSVELLKALSMEVRSAEELHETILLGKRKRATEATERNGASSRSHAVCQITIAHKKNVRIYYLQISSVFASIL
jgi:kinesin family protein 2/24